MKKLSEFQKYILEADKTHYYGAIVRDENFNVIKVGIFEVGKLASYTTPVRRKTQEIKRFEGQWAVFSSGRVEISHLEGWTEPDYN